MSEEKQVNNQKRQGAIERRGFFYIIMGGALAAITGWIAGIFPRIATDEKAEMNLGSAEARISALETRARNPTVELSASAGDARLSALETQVSVPTSEVNSSSVEAKISALEAKLAQQTNELKNMTGLQPIAELQGGNDELVVFNKKELTVINNDSDAVFLNLVNPNGGVGIRFYKDFGFGNEQMTNPWSIWIEGVTGYQNLAIIRDWRFTAALWDADGRFLTGKLDPYPPGNPPAKARFDVRGSLDEVQAIIEANGNQTSDIFQVTSGNGSKHFTVNGAGNAVIGSPDKPNEIILYDTVDGSAYSLKVTNGQLIVTKV
jgi:uncharacterized coiled-coil protein SlyX